MAVDRPMETVIHRPRALDSAYASDPSKAPVRALRRATTRELGRLEQILEG